MSEHDALAIWLPDGRIAPPVNPYGRLIANAGVYRALARYGGYGRVHLQSRTPPPPAQLAAELGVGAHGCEVTTGPLFSTAPAAQAGTLLSGQPYLTEPAWVRRHAGLDGAYSIVGTIFAFASATHREQMMTSALAPVHEWDALICSSPSVRATVERTFDVWQEHLGERLSVSGLRLPRPQLPVIGFGTDTEAIGVQASDRKARASMRTSLGIDDSDVVVYCLGRLSYYDKAFPQAMFKAVAAAQARTGVATHLVLTGWFPQGDADRSRFEEAARAYAPGVPLHILDGNDASVVARCWAAADIFLLLSDTILETFGQALTEAMAAGLPLVVSDWDGYRWIVRDGVDGFLIPTLGAPGGPLGESLGLAQQLGLADFAQYAGSVAQHTAVNVGRTTAALSALLTSPDLRRAMGAAGRARAQERFAWPVVAQQYIDLFDELAERRDRASGWPPEATRDGVPGRRSNPLRGDPFADFRTLPSQVLDDDIVLRLAPGATGAPAAPDLPVTELDQMFPGLRADDRETRQVIDLLASAGELPVRGILAEFPAQRRRFIRMTLVWLAKAGVVDWLAPP